MTQTDRSVQLSEEVPEEIEQGQEAAIGAVRGFVVHSAGDTVGAGEEAEEA